MTEASISQYITDKFPGVEATTNLGYTFFFYGSDRMLPFATIASTGNEYERVSNLDRPGVFRLNIGITRQTFESLFGTQSPDLKRHDFTALDTIMPHPDYAKQHYVCILNPSDETMETIRQLLAEAYNLAISREAKRSRNE